ncbi:MAG: hypothetical protein UHD09_09160 [Bifidobacterium sp.]|nr:hypothetical protein [Bifidobacterium sp.]
MKQHPRTTAGAVKRARMRYWRRVVTLAMGASMLAALAVPANAFATNMHAGDADASASTSTSQTQQTTTDTDTQFPDLTGEEGTDVSGADGSSPTNGTDAATGGNAADANGSSSDSPATVSGDAADGDTVDVDVAGPEAAAQDATDFPLAGDEFELNGTEGAEGLLAGDGTSADGLLAGTDESGDEGLMAGVEEPVHEIVDPEDLDEETVMSVRNDGAWTMGVTTEFDFEGMVTEVIEGTERLDEDAHPWSADEEYPDSAPSVMPAVLTDEMRAQIKAENEARKAAEEAARQAAEEARLAAQEAAAKAEAEAKA